MMSLEKEAVIDLDSFFKSKDKKKNKKTTKINPTKLLERTKEGLEGGRERSDRARREKAREETREEIVSDLLRKTKEDDEWEDTYTQEVDLANLKIGKMPVKIEEKPKVEVIVAEESEDDGEEKLDKQVHPWGGKPTNVISGECEVIERIEVNQSQKYVPPSQRGSGTVGLRVTRKPPNITNSTEFPSLREAVDIETEDSSWSRVSKGGHCEKVDKPSVTSKHNNVEKQNAASKKVCSTDFKASAPESSIYVLPHLRKAHHRANENKYNGLSEESLN